MSAAFRFVRKSIFALESFEILSIVVAIVLAIIFMTGTSRIDRVLGLIGYHSAFADNIAAIARSEWTYVFIPVLAALCGGHFAFRSADNAKLKRLSKLCRVMITFLVMMTVYKIVNFYICVFNPFDRDLALQHIDKAIFFGRMPAQWLEPMIHPVFNWLFGLSYLSWFVLVYITILLLVKDKQALREYVFTAMLTFYLGYTVYAIVPAIGPIFTVHFDKSIGGIPQLLVMGQSVLSRDCFPSLHTGISLVMAINIWRHRRTWSWLYVPLAACIIFSTLYLRVHYGFDVIAGAALAVTTTRLGPLMVQDWERWRSRLTTRTAANDVPASMAASGRNRSFMA